MCGVQWQGCSSRPWWQALAPRTGISLLCGFQYCHQKYGSPSGPPTPRFLLVSLMLMDVTCSPPPAHCCYSRSPPPTRSAPSSHQRITVDGTNLKTWRKVLVKSVGEKCWRKSFRQCVAEPFFIFSIQFLLHCSTFLSKLRN